MSLHDTILSLEYEAQFFGIHPRNFVNEVYNTFYDNMLISLTNLKQDFIQQYRAIISSVIELSAENMFQDIVSRCNKSIDKLEVFLYTNIFNIDPEVVLPEDNIHTTNPCTKEDEDKVDKEITELKKQIFHEISRKHALKKVISGQKYVKERLMASQNKLNSMLNIFSQEGVTIQGMEDFNSELKSYQADQKEIKSLLENSLQQNNLR